MTVVSLKNVCLFLIEELDTLLGVAQEDVLGVDDYLVTGPRSVNPCIDLEGSVLTVPE